MLDFLRNAKFILILDSEKNGRLLPELFYIMNHKKSSMVSESDIRQSQFRITALLVYSYKGCCIFTFDSFLLSRYR